MSIFARYQGRYESLQEEELSLQEYLELCRNDKSAYASVAERMLLAIGEPELLDTRSDSRLSRLFANKMLKIYPAFREFYGMEEVIENIVAYFRHARYMPVMDKRMLMGVISFYDVAKAVVDSQNFENQMLKAYIRDWPAEDDTKA